MIFNGLLIEDNVTEAVRAIAQTPAPRMLEYRSDF